MLITARKLLNTEREGTGGLLFIVVSIMLTFMLVTCFTLARLITTRSVAESVEHTIALQCLASCYINPVDNGLTTTTTEHAYGSEATFAPISGNGHGIEIDPTEQFNNIMTELHLMRDGTDWSGEVGLSSGTKQALYRKYTKDSAEGYTKGQATFTLQMQPFIAFNSWWNITDIVQPKATTVVIERTYSANEDTNGVWGR